MLKKLAVELCGILERMRDETEIEMLLQVNQLAEFRPATYVPSLALEQAILNASSDQCTESNVKQLRDYCDLT